MTRRIQDNQLQKNCLKPNNVHSRKSALFASFIPTVSDLSAKKFEDEAFPWGLASFGYIFQLIAVANSIQVLLEDWPRLINPILVGLIGNGMVSWTAFRSKRRTQND